MATMTTSLVATDRAVRRYMAREHVSVSELARRMDMHPRTMNSRVHGQTRWTLDDLDELARLGVIPASPADLLADEDDR
jgi:plasmid maintenance system antidote protein VapI